MAIPKLFSVTAEDQLQLVALLMRGNQRLVLLLFPTFRVLRNPSREFWIATTLKLLKIFSDFGAYFYQTLGSCHERTTNWRYLFYSLQSDRPNVSLVHIWKSVKKRFSFAKKENSALSEHTWLTNHTIGWLIITTNRCYHQHLCLEAWHIKSAHAPLHRDDGGLLPDAYLHLVRKKIS